MAGKSKGLIVLIHGLWMIPESWEKWAARYMDMGYHVFTPTWSVLEGARLRDVRSDPSVLRGFGVREMFRDLRTFIEKLDSPPILMGHSFGGLMVQLLLNEGLGSAGVAIHPAQTKGVYRLPPTTISAAWPALKNPFDVEGIVDLSFNQFCEVFATGVPRTEVRQAYTEYYIPAPKRPLIQVALSNLTPHAPNTVDYKNPIRAPLLFVAGTDDRLTPPSVVKENCGNYQTPTKTEFKLYQGRSHFTLSQSGWEKVADDCLRWAVANREVAFNVEDRDEGISAPH